MSSRANVSTSPTRARASTNSSSDSSGERLADEEASSAPSPRRILRLAALLLYVALFGTAARLMELPIGRAIELRYCQKYYLEHDPSRIGRDGSIPEEWCKVDQVQLGLGWMLGTLGTLTTLCGKCCPLHPAGLLLAHSIRHSRHRTDGHCG